MKKTVVTKLPAGEIVEIKKLADGTFAVTQHISEVLIAATLILIEAEKLSMDDEFMKYEPVTEVEKETKALITEVIDAKVKNFYRPNFDPTFTKTGEGICFAAGKKPAINKSYKWWDWAAKKYMPERNSRLGTRLEYGAFLGVLIKKLIAEGKSVEWAWNAVCNDSRELGHYRDSENAKRVKFETTGSRCICGFCDLANTIKILAVDSDTDDLWLAGGWFGQTGDSLPLAGLESEEYPDLDVDYLTGVGWIVLS